MNTNIIKQLHFYFPHLTEKEIEDHIILLRDKNERAREAKEFLNKWNTTVKELKESLQKLKEGINEPANM